MKTAKFTALAGSLLVAGAALAGPATAAVATQTVPTAPAASVSAEQTHPGISARMINDSPYGMNIKVTSQDGLLDWRHVMPNEAYRVDSSSTALNQESWTRVEFDYDGGTRADGHRSLLITNPVASNDPIKATWSDTWGREQFSSVTFDSRGKDKLADIQKTQDGRRVAMSWTYDNVLHNTHVFEISAKADGNSRPTPAPAAG